MEEQELITTATSTFEVWKWALGAVSVIVVGVLTKGILAWRKK